MRWVRIYSQFSIHPGGGPPPVFRITSDDDGFANIQLAKRPELLANPVCDPGDTWSVFDSHSGSVDGSVTGVQVRLQRGVADYTLPEAAWRAMASNETHRIYYRVTASTQVSGAEAYHSHSDEAVLRGDALYFDVHPSSGTPTVDPPESDAAVWQAVGAWNRLMLQIVWMQQGSPAQSALADVLNHPTYRELGAPVRAKLLDLFVKCGANGRRIFTRLLDMRVAVGSLQDGNARTVAAVVHRDERNEGTLVDHLLALWSARLSTRIAISNSALIYDLMMELTDPGAANQGRAGTCAATSVMIYMSRRNPAEVARWGRYLLDMNHLSVRLANGDRMRISSRAYSPENWNSQNLFTRTYSERAIQAALMDYGNFRLRYDPATDNFRTWLGTAMGSGLWCFEITRLLEGAFNQGWEWNFGGGSWDAPNRAQATASLLAHFNNSGLEVMVVTLWGGGSHATVGLKVEGNRVVVRNPQYRGGWPPYATGSNQSNPARRVHNASRAEESFDQASLNSVMIGFCFESSAAERGYRIAEIPSHLQPTVTPTLR